MSKPKRRRNAEAGRHDAASGLRSSPEDGELERLRLERIMTDGVTGLRIHPLADLRNERVATLGVIYLQLGRFAAAESLCGWELYDRVLQVFTASLREDLKNSPLKRHLLSFQFTGSDGFYLLFDLSGEAAGGRDPRLEEEASRFREGALRRLRKTLGRTIVDLMSVHSSCLAVPDEPRVRPSRNFIRALREAARAVDSRENNERLELVAGCKEIISGRKLRAVYQPVFDIRDRSVVGYEALIRGPAGSELESPEVLFAAARESDIGLELENLCLETIFGRLPGAARRKKLFVNASSKLLTHAVFLDDRNLAEIRRAHPRVVVEISEKEVVRDYPAFREVLSRLRSSGLEVAIDDAGSGYSGLESILQLRPEYIKVADSIVHNLHLDTIKREVITALGSLSRQTKSSLVAEGIEQPEELSSLLELGVNYGQGFLLGRPSSRLAAEH